MDYVSSTGRVQFRHPIIKSVTINRGIGKLSSREQGAIDDDLVWLHSVRPLKRSEVGERELHPKAADWWFGPIEAAEREKKYAERARSRGFPEPPARDETAKDHVRAKNEATLSDEERLRVAQWKAEDAERRAKEAEKKAEELQRTVTDLGQRLGRQDLDREGVTLAECLAHFEAKVSCSSEDAKASLMTRVRKVVEQIGTSARHHSITKKDVEDAVEATKPESKNEARVRRYSIKRFFTLLSHPVSSDGLGLPNPAAAMTVGSIQKIQAERRRKGLVTQRDPKEFLRIKGLGLYWKALIACMGYAGLRLAEAASLEWDRVGKTIIKVRPTDFYPETKTLGSERDVPFFPNLGPILAKYKKVARHKKLVFDRPTEKGPTWFKAYKGKAKAYALSEALSNALGAAIGLDYMLKDGRKIKVRRQSRRKVDGVDTLFLQLWDGERIQVPRADVSGWETCSIAYELRHFWETSMRKAGLADLIDATAGHSKGMGKAHYEVHDEVVRKAKVPKL